jgi:hypothetical protein
MANGEATPVGPVTGRQYIKTRDRGLIDWHPQKDTRSLLKQVQEIIDEYDQALTVRQIYYRLVGKYNYDKTEQAYDRLGEHLNKARHAGIIGWDAIRDDTDVVPPEPGYGGPAECWDLMKDIAKGYERRPVGDTYVEIWVEAAGMQPQIEAVAEPFGVRVCAGGGFNSSTARYKAAQRLSAIDRQVHVLLIGDYDPSGLSIMDVCAGDVLAHGAEARFEHLAVTSEQAEEYGLPSKPQKPTDKRGEDMTETWQAEALDPAVLADIVRTRLDALIPEDVRAQAARQTQRERAKIVRTLQRITEE